MLSWGDVWRKNPEFKNSHPAPFPIEIAIRMAKLVDGLIVDPFAGSGTIGIAAIDLGLPYIINDISPEDQEMFNLRRDQNKTQCEIIDY